MARRPGHHRKPTFDGVLPGCLEQLVDESLDRIASVGVSDRAPPQDRHADLNLMQIAFEVCNLIGNFVRSLVHGRVESLFHRHRFKRRPLHDRLADDSVCPRLDLSVADHAAHAVHAEWTVVTAAHVVLAGPNTVDGVAWTDGFCNFSKLSRDVHRLLRAPPKTAARENGLKLDLLHPDAEHLRDRGMV